MCLEIDVCALMATLFIWCFFFFPLQWVGSPCGLHGPYIFYKAFQFHLEGKPRILSLGDFFFVRCTPKDPICIAELQLLWEERTSRQLLSSSKLYFLPEDTPQGRNSDHGEVVNLYLPLFFLYYFPLVMLITGQAWKYCIHFCRRAGSTPFLKG